MDAFEAVSSPGLSPLSGKKLFSGAEANRALSLVRRVVSDVVGDYRQLRELHAACRTFDAQGDVARAEEARKQYASIADHLSELNEELEQIGCELKDYHLGLVDFSTSLGGREVYLCWKLGETKVEHWHEVSRSCAERRPVPDAVEVIPAEG